MPSILTNTAALTAQRNLNNSSAAAASSIAKLSSGSRIVKPSDDAASLAISNRLRADIVSLEQAGRNASQGASLLQIANGAYDRIGDMLARMKVLSTQAINGALSATERAYAQEEFSSLRDQITATSEQTRFAGQSLLTGGGGTVTQASNVVEGSTGLTAVANAFAGTMDAALTQGFITGIATDATVKANGSLYDVSVKIGDQTFKATTSPTAAGDLTLVSTTDARNTITFDYAAAVSAITDASTFQTSLRNLLGVDSASKAVFTSSSIDLTSAVNGFSSTSVSSGSGTAAGSYAVEYSSTNKTFTLTNGSQTWTKAVTEAGAQTVTFDNGVEVSLASTFVLGANIGQSTLKVAAGTNVSMDFQVAEKSSDQVSVDFTAATATALGLDGLTLATTSGAETASAALDKAINTVNTAQAGLGALQSRFEFIQANIATTVENMSAAKGTFKDVDVAKEMSEFTKQQTLSQASVSMLSQANQMPQQLLKLLG